MPRELDEWQDEIAANMLEDLAAESGMDLLDILASEVENPLSNFEVFDVYEESTDSEPLDLETDEYDGINDYLEDFVDDYDGINDYLEDFVDDYDVADEQDAYGEEAL